MIKLNKNSDKKIILYLHPHFSIEGGAGKFALETGERIATIEKNISINFITLNINPEIIKHYKNINFKSIASIKTDSFKFWLLFPYWQIKINKEINRTISPYKKENVVIFPQVFPANYWGAIYKIIHPNIKVIWMCQEPSAFIHSKQWINAIPSKLKKSILLFLHFPLVMIDIFLCRKFDLIIGNSNFTGENIKKIYNRNADSIINPGVDVDKFIISKEKTKKIIAIGRLTKFKNFDLIIKGFNLFVEKYPKYKLNIIGKGEEEENLKLLISKLKVKEKIQLLGGLNQKSLINLISTSSLLIAASENEPFGITPIEAISCGVPVIAHNSGGFKETILVNKTGILYPSLNEKEICKAMINALTKETDFYSKEQMHKYIENKYNWEIISRKLSSFIFSYQLLNQISSN